MSIKQNCWEFTRCGREPHGAKSIDLGVCPAAADHSFDGINEGKCAGRICWAVAGTLCGGKVQGTFAEKRGNDISMTKFLRYLSEEKRGMLGSLSYRFVRAGERFITQGVPKRPSEILSRWIKRSVVSQEAKTLTVCNRQLTSLSAIPLKGNPRSAF